MQRQSRQHGGVLFENGPHRRVGRRLEHFKPPHTFLATFCASVTLTANTTYWIVFPMTNRNDEVVALATTPDVTDSYGSGWSVVGSGKKTTASWVVQTDAQGRIGLWAEGELGVGIAEVTSAFSRSGGFSAHPTNGRHPRRAGVARRQRQVHLRAALQRGPRKEDLQLQDAAGPCVHGDGEARWPGPGGFGDSDTPLSYPDAAVDTIVAVDDNLPVFDNITGQIITLSGHKIDGTLTN